MKTTTKISFGWKILRIAGIAILAYLIALGWMQRSEATQIHCGGYVINSQGIRSDLDCFLPVSRPQKNGILPLTASPEWHPDRDNIGKWGVRKTQVGDEYVKKYCLKEAYACAINWYSGDENKTPACVVYMPDFEIKPGQSLDWAGSSGGGEILYRRVPKGQKPPVEWFWLLGREQGHCLFGSYHD
jgi:hypothetical protein